MSTQVPLDSNMDINFTARPAQHESAKRLDPICEDVKREEDRSNPKRLLLTRKNFWMLLAILPIIVAYFNSSSPKEDSFDCGFINILNATGGIAYRSYAEFLHTSHCSSIPDGVPVMVHIPKPTRLFTCEDPIPPIPTRFSELLVHIMVGLFFTNYMDQFNPTKWTIVTGVEAPGMKCDIGTKLAKIQDTGYLGVILVTNRTSKSVRQMLHESKEKRPLHLDIIRIDPREAEALIQLKKNGGNRAVFNHSVPNQLLPCRSSVFKSNIGRSVKNWVWLVKVAGTLYLILLCYRRKRLAFAKQIQEGTQEETQRSNKQSHQSSHSSGDRKQEKYRNAPTEFEIETPFNKVSRCFQILDIPLSKLEILSHTELIKAYKKKAKAEHPDKGNPNDPEDLVRKKENFQEISNAYKYLLEIYFPSEEEFAV